MLHKFHLWDDSALLWLQNHLRQTWLTIFMKMATFLGNGGILWIALCIILLFFRETRFAAAAGFLALLCSVLVINALLKNLIGRDRPFNRIQDLIVLIKRPQDFSFPSGHTSSSFAVSTVFLCTLPFWLGLPALLIAFTIAFSRLYLGAHYPTDVLCGAILGILFGTAALYLLPLLLYASWMPEGVQMFFR